MGAPTDVRYWRTVVENAEHEKERGGKTERRNERNGNAKQNRTELKILRRN